MASPSRREDPALAPDLRETVRAGNFEAAMMLLRRAGLLRADGRPESALAFVSEPGHAYPAEECSTAIQVRQPRQQGEIQREILAVATPLFGLLGTIGVLPSHLSAWIQERVKQGDRAALDFLDLFHGRLVQLLLQAHLRHRFWLRHAWDSARLPGEVQSRCEPFQEAIYDLLGLSDPETRLRCGLPPAVLLYHAGLLARRPCSATALEHVLADYFDAPVRIRTFLGDWVPIPAETRNSLHSPSPLGESFALGDRYFDPADRFRIEFGPLGRALFQELLPRADGAQVLTQLVRFALGPGQRFDYLLALRSEDVPPALLGSAVGGPALGQSLWTQSVDVGQTRWAGPFEPALIEETREPELAA